MFVYIDESGNSGNNLFDVAQPYFYAGAIITKDDFDQTYGDEIRGLAKELGVAALHANELGVGKLEVIALKLQGILEKAQASFAVSFIEKLYLGYAKFVDIYFDQGENEGVPYEWYWLIKPRLFWLLGLKKNNVITRKALETLWKCFTTSSMDVSRKYFVECANIVYKRVHLIQDTKIKTITTGALEWAIEHPEAFALVREPGRIVCLNPDPEIIINPKLAVYDHSPNFQGFMQLLTMIEAISQQRGEAVDLITHDIQLDLKLVFSRWHTALSRPEIAGVKTPWPGEKDPIALGLVNGSKFKMLEDEKSPGLQVVDILLWLCKRRNEAKKLGDNCESLLKWLENASFMELSFKGAMGRVVAK